MKKTLLLTFCLMMLIACDSAKKSPTETLIEEAEKKLKSRLYDSASYEFVSFTADTLHKEKIKQKLEALNSKLEEYKKDAVANKDLIAQYNEEIESTKSMLLPSNQIEFILEYRAKNSAGRSNPGSSRVISDKSYNLIDIVENID